MKQKDKTLQIKKNREAKYWRHYCYGAGMHMVTPVLELGTGNTRW